MRRSLPRPATRKGGKVYLVGAGPGDPGLLTVRARELLETADRVLADRLVGDAIRTSVPAEKLVDVGREPGSDVPTEARQAAIHETLVRLARAGLTGIRLKGGDPFVFGRGGEEAEALRAAGIPYEVVPGVTSATACPGAFEIPLTHRGEASAFTVVTGREGEGKEAAPVPWEALAAAGGTIVVLMGVATLGGYAMRLRKGGLSPDTPVAVIERGTLPGQRLVRGTLATIEGEARKAGVEPPAVVVVGRVAARAREVGDES